LFGNLDEPDFFIVRKPENPANVGLRVTVICG
jgi:hypothetical protein